MADPVIDQSKTYFGADQTYKFSRIITGAVVQSGKEVTPDSTTIFEMKSTEEGDILEAYGPDLPSAEAGYVQGCIFLWTGASAGEEALYENVGDESSCSFEAIGEPTELEKKPKVTSSVFTLVDNDNANNGDRVMIKLSPRTAPNVTLVADTGDGHLGWVNDGGGVVLVTPEYVSPTPTTTILHNADPVSNLAATQVYAKYVGGNKVILVSDNDSGNNSFFADSNGKIWPVMFDAAAAEGAPVYFDEDASDPDDRLQIISPTSEDLFFYTPFGVLRLKHSATAAGDGVLVYIDDNGATADQKLCFVSPTTTNGDLSMVSYEEYLNQQISEFTYIPLYVNEDAEIDQKFVHDFQYMPVTFLVPVLGENKYLSIAYDADAATYAPVYVNSGSADVDLLEFTSPSDADTEVDTNLSLRPQEETVDIEA